MARADRRRPARGLVAGRAEGRPGGLHARHAHVHGGQVLVRDYSFGFCVERPQHFSLPRAAANRCGVIPAASAAASVPGDSGARSGEPLSAAPLPPTHRITGLVS